MSETAKLRDLLLPYCVGNGVDGGFGGDKIKPEVIGIERDNALMHAGSQPANLIGDITNLYWFKDNVLDYFYNSHTLEDFEPERTKTVISEWTRVIKDGGHLVLNLPHDRLFYQNCVETGQAYNFEHKCFDMSIEYMRKIQKEINEEKGYEFMQEILYTGIQYIYCFGVVYKINKRG